MCIIASGRKHDVDDSAACVCGRSLFFEKRWSGFEGSSREWCIRESNALWLFLVGYLKAKVFNFGSKDYFSFCWKEAVKWYASAEKEAAAEWSAVAVDKAVEWTVSDGGFFSRK